MTWSPTLAAVKAAAAEHFSMTVPALDARRHNKKLFRARMVAIKAASQLTEKTLGQIGNSLGGRDHTTVLHSLRRFDAAAAKDEQLQADLETIVAKVKAGASTRIDSSVNMLADLIANQVVKAVTPAGEAPRLLPPVSAAPALSPDFLAAIEAVCEASRRLDEAQFTSLERAARKNLEQSAAKLRGFKDRQKETING